MPPPPRCSRRWRPSSALPRGWCWSLGRTHPADQRRRIAPGSSWRRGLARRGSGWPGQLRGGRPGRSGPPPMARIDALDPRDGAVDRRAAVLGINFHPRRLADVLATDTPLPEDGFWDRLSSVFACEPDGHVRFKRPAIQEVAYASLPFRLRRELHMAVGLRLELDAGRELDAGPAILSHHFLLAGAHARAHRDAMAARPPA